MHVLAIHPGSDVAIGDVYTGLVAALERQGVTVTPYALSARIDRAASWLHHLWQTTGADPANRPNDADVAYQAGVGAIERALRLQVDWVFVISGMYLHPDVIIMLRRAGCRIALLLTESPYEAESEQRLLRWADVAWTNERTCVAPYRAFNGNVHYLAHAYDPARHTPLPGPSDAVLAHDVVFVGTPFPERVELLEAIDWTGIDLGLYGFWNESIGPDSPLRPYIRAETVTNTEAAALYRRAKIGLNLFRSSRNFEDHSVRISGAESLNPRSLELAACGVFQISEWRPEVVEVFGASVPTFRDAAQLQDLLRFYLERAPERALLADFARERVQGRTFDERAVQVLEDLARVSQVLVEA